MHVRACARVCARVCVKMYEAPENQSKRESVFFICEFDADLHTKGSVRHAHTPNCGLQHDTWGGSFG